MFKIKKLIVSMVLLIMALLMISHVSAAEYYVNKDTTHKNITDWMSNTAQKGDKLIFTGSTYQLKDTLVVTKPIIIGSLENTVIKFNKNKTMIDIQTNATNIIGISLIHTKTGIYIDNNTGKSLSTISTSTMQNSYIKFNMKNTKIITLNHGININIEGNIINSYIKSDSSCISSSYWKGHLYKSTLKGTIGIGTFDGINPKWVGNCIRSNITARFSPFSTNYYKGTIFKSRIYSTITDDDIPFSALYVGSGKFIINRSIISSKTYSAIKIGKNRPKFKVIKSKIISPKGWSKYNIDRY